MTAKLTPQQKRYIQEQRKIERNNRIKLINQIDVLRYNNCRECPRGVTYSNTSNAVCSGCEIFTEITSLGKQLNDNVNNKRAETEHIAKYAKPSKPLKPVKEEINVAKLSIEEYQDYRAQGLKDKDIAKRTGMPITSIYTFKHANGLTNKRKSVSEPVSVKNVVPEVFAPVVAPVVEPVAEIPVAKPKNHIAHSEVKGQAPVEMPTIDADWVPKVQNTIDTYFAERAEKSAEVKAEVKASVVETTIAESEPVESHDKEQFILQQYELEKAKREVELWKSRYQECENRLFNYMQDYRNLDTDLRNEIQENKRLQDMLDKMKQTKLLNYLLMKDSVSMIEQLDTMAEKKEIGEFVWR